MTRPEHEITEWVGENKCEVCQKDLHYSKVYIVETNKYDLILCPKHMMDVKKYIKKLKNKL